MTQRRWSREAVVAAREERQERAESDSAVAAAIRTACRIIVTPMMEVSSRNAGSVFLAVAGLYQWTPWKRACLTACQSPLAFLMRRWRSGAWGAFRMGLEHGAYCVGCCWALMLLLFAGGVMYLTMIAALTAFVTFEKLAPIGIRSARVSGLLLLAAAGWLFFRA